MSRIPEKDAVDRGADAGAEAGGAGGAGAEAGAAELIPARSQIPWSGKQCVVQSLP